MGTHTSLQRSRSEHEDDYGDTTGYSKQLSEIRELVVQPHELATLDNVLLLTPYGFCRAEKYRPYDDSKLLRTPKVIHVKAVSATLSESKNAESIPSIGIRFTVTTPNDFIMNEGAKMMSINERTANAKKRIDAAEQQRLLEQRREQDAQKRRDSRRNYVISELVTRYFPSVREHEPGTNAENRTRFEPLEAFLYILSTDYDLYRELQERAAQLVSENPEGEWRLSE